MATQDGWDIPTGCNPCDACGAEPAPGDMLMSMIVFGAADDDGSAGAGLGIARKDLCTACAESVEPGEDVFYWRHRVPEDGQPRLVVDYQMLREIFLHLVKRGDDDSERLAYLVGLVLLRKRLLRLKGFEARDGREVMVVTKGAGQPEVVVPAPHLDAEELVETRRRLARLLQSDLPEDLAVDEILAEADRSPDAEADADGSPDDEPGGGNGAPAGDDGVEAAR